MGTVMILSDILLRGK